MSLSKDQESLLSQLQVEREHRMARWQTPNTNQPRVLPKAVHATLPSDLLVAEVEHLLGTDSPQRIAARLGLSAPWLHTRLVRIGRTDLARHFPQHERRTP